MAKRKKNLSPNYQPWVDARKRFHLSDMHIQMARELGMNPRKLGKHGPSHVYLLNSTVGLRQQKVDA